MNYIILFLEGIITFISPCLLPMLPIYLSYFAGQDNDFGKRKTITNAFGFILGFTLVFITLGAFAGTAGSFLREYQTLINIISGGIVILFGLHFMGAVRVPVLNKTKQWNIGFVNLGFFSSLLFGIIFSIGWTPCVGAFLGSALMFATQEGETIKGILMLLSFSLGLGIPFMASAILIDQLKSTFDLIKRNYKMIHLLSGIFLVMMGALMATGWMGYFLSLLTF